jgi:hypothetical protein
MNLNALPLIPPPLTWTLTLNLNSPLGVEVSHASYVNFSPGIVITKVHNDGQIFHINQVSTTNIPAGVGDQFYAIDNQILPHNITLETFCNIIQSFRSSTIPVMTRVTFVRPSQAVQKGRTYTDINVPTFPNNTAIATVTTNIKRNSKSDNVALGSGAPPPKKMKLIITDAEREEQRKFQEEKKKLREEKKKLREEEKIAREEKKKLREQEKIAREKKKRLREQEKKARIQKRLEDKKKREEEKLLKKLKRAEEKKRREEEKAIRDEQRALEKIRRSHERRIHNEQEKFNKKRKDIKCIQSQKKKSVIKKHQTIIRNVLRENIEIIRCVESYLNVIDGTLNKHYPSKACLSTTDQLGYDRYLANECSNHSIITDAIICQIGKKWRNDMTYEDKKVLSQCSLGELMFVNHYHASLNPPKCCKSPHKHWDQVMVRERGIFFCISSL